MIQPNDPGKILTDLSPALSVVMPVYNCQDYLAEAIKSILAQSYQDFEFIIVDDGSTDASRQIIKHYARLDERIRPLYQQNQGIAMALNAGLATARGKLIARMDGDDIALPHRFERQIHFLRQNPHIGVVGSACQVINRAGAITRKLPIQREGGATFLKWHMIFGVPVAHPTVMMRAEIFEENRYKAVPAEDYELWLRLAPTVLFDNLQETLLLYRSHPGGMTKTKSQEILHDSACSRQAHLKRTYGIDVSLEESIALSSRRVETVAQAVALTQLLRRVWGSFQHSHLQIPRDEYRRIHLNYLWRRYRISKKRGLPARALAYAALLLHRIRIKVTRITESRLAHFVSDTRVSTVKADRCLERDNSPGI